MTRALIIVDCETTGLNLNRAVPIEIAAINTATGEELYIAPWTDQLDMGRAEPVAMTINRYFERRVYENIDRSTERDKAEQLGDWLCGNTLGGSNPTFDAAMLDIFFARHGHDKDTDQIAWEPHHRFADLAAYAAGKLDLDPTDLPGLAEVCALLGVEQPDHTAMGDARVTWVCFQKLQETTR